jgi:hypothetical protein
MSEIKKSPHRLTLTQIVEKQIAAMTTSSTERSGVKLTLNARGETQVEVKVSTAEDGTGTIEAASEKAQLIFDALTAKYVTTVRKAA